MNDDRTVEEIELTKVWVVRAGSDGEHEHANLQENTAVIGWNVGDLTAVRTRADVRELIDLAYPDDSTGRQANYTGQVWAFRSQIQPGDIVVMPSKFRAGYIYLGECKGEYVYELNEKNLKRRHQLPVEWLTEPVSKSVIKDDLLNSLNSIMTVFNPTRNNASQRVRALYDSGRDPGNNSNLPRVKSLLGSSTTEIKDEVTDPEPTPTLEAIKDRIRIHIVENFSDHKLTRLVADILEALGFQCDISSPGPDGGVDILAGSGPLGLDSPTLIVEVKSEPTPVDVKVVRGLHSAMTQHRADQGLLVAWGGVTKPAMREFQRDRTSFRIWDAEELLNQLFETYERLPADTQARLPLKRAWVLDENPR